MILHSIEIKNFRCYQEQRVEFAKQTTIMIGRNGTGKTSLVKALRNGLSMLFSQNKNWGVSKNLVGLVTDLSVANLRVDDVWHDADGNTADFIEFRINAEFAGFDLPQWSFFKETGERSQVQPSRYKDAYIEIMNRIASGKYPLMAYYSDRFPHIDTKLGAKVKKLIDNEDFIDHRWGYYHWDKDSSCSEIWKKRFIRIENLRFRMSKELSKPNFSEEAAQRMGERLAKFEAETKFITKRLQDFSSNSIEGLSDTSNAMSVRELMTSGVSSSYILVLFQNGEQSRWDELPAGYERLYNIAFDIACRSFILNGNSEPEGIVLIDEVDLHLHPALEQDVMLRFRNAFPKVQFIVSTHSPLVISNFRQNKDNYILRLDKNEGVYENQKVGDVFGLDYGLTLSDVMGVQPQNIYLKMLEERYVRLLRRNRVAQAEEVLNEVRRLSESRAEAVLEHAKKRIG